MRFVLALLAASLFPSDAGAQWVPAPGDGSVAVSYQYTRAFDHLFSEDVDGVVDPASGYVGGPGNRWYLGDLYGMSGEIFAELGLWRGLAANVSAAYVSSKYSGLFAEGPLDDGRFHGGMQDLTASLRYMIPWNGFAVTPALSMRMPLNDYQQLGHTSIGRGLSEFSAGLSSGRSLDPWLPNAYLAGSFTYAFVEDHHEHQLDQRRYGVDGGYIFNERLSIGGSLQYTVTVDGIDWLTDIVTAQHFHDHDIAAKTRSTRLGGYVSYTPTSAFGVRIGYSGIVAGENTHAAQSLTLSPYWNFRAPFGR